eukprot:288255-Pleurochrysis_carterae.AAC.1
MRGAEERRGTRAGRREGHGWGEGREMDEEGLRGNTKVKVVRSGGEGNEKGGKEGRKGRERERVADSISRSLACQRGRSVQCGGCTRRSTAGSRS